MPRSKTFNPIADSIQTTGGDPTNISRASFSVVNTVTILNNLDPTWTHISITVIQVDPTNDQTTFRINFHKDSNLLHFLDSNLPCPNNCYPIVPPFNTFENIHFRAVIGEACQAGKGYYDVAISQLDKLGSNSPSYAIYTNYESVPPYDTNKLIYISQSF